MGKFSWRLAACVLTAALIAGCYVSGSEEWQADAGKAKLNTMGPPSSGNAQPKETQRSPDKKTFEGIKSAPDDKEREDREYAENLKRLYKGYWESMSPSIRDRYGLTQSEWWGAVWWDIQGKKERGGDSSTFRKAVLKESDRLKAPQADDEYLWYDRAEYYFMRWRRDQE